MKRTLLFVIVLVMSFTLLSACSEQSDNDDNSALNVVRSNEIEAFGRLDCLSRKDIVLGLPAEMVKLEVREGQKVAMGNHLATLNLDRAKSDFEGQEAEIKTQRSQIDLAIAQNDVMIAENNLAADQSNQTTAQSNLRMAQDNLTESQRAYLAVQKSEIDASEKLLNIEKGKLNTSFLQGDTIICDMSNALVEDIQYQDGGVIDPNRKILTLVDLDTLVVLANLNEAFIKDVRIGTKAYVTPMFDKAKTYEGSVTYISSRGVFLNGEYVIPITITLDQKDDSLNPGYSVEIRIPK